MMNSFCDNILYQSTGVLAGVSRSKQAPNDGRRSELRAGIKLLLKSGEVPNTTGNNNTNGSRRMKKVQGQTRPRSVLIDRQSQV